MKAALVPPEMRRKRTPWTKDETEQLLKGMRMYGKNWKLILSNFTFNACRTNVDLKDKFRNMFRKK